MKLRLTATETLSKPASQQMTALLRLRELLLNGELAPGSRLAEIPLAQRLRVSRTPLRLALISLEHEGLVEEHATRGYVVRQIRRADIFDAIDIRGTLEGMAARLAVERAGREFAGLDKLRFHVAAIDAALETMDQSPEDCFNTYIHHNQIFHQHLLALAASPAMEREVARVTGLPFAAPSSGFVRVQADLARSRHVLRIGQDQHAAILDALEHREAGRAEALMREHARLARINLEIALESHVQRTPIPALRLIQDAAVGPSS